MQTRFIRMVVIAAIAPLLAYGAHAQSDKPKGAGASASAATELDAARTLKAAANALGVPRWSQVGGGHLPELDAINTLAFTGSGAPYSEYRASVGYNPPGMRVEMTQANLHSIGVVSGSYAWNESEVGAGLVPGKGTATPDTADYKVRLLQLWTLPYGVIKAGWAAGDKLRATTENGATVMRFPLSGQLAGVGVKVTLNDKNLIAKVETKGNSADLITETDYSDYADRGDIPTDVQFPGHIVRKQGGKTLLDIQVKTADANNPYLIFPVPDNVTNAVAQ